MNKILTLYNIEFKRIYKLYFALLGTLVVGNIVVASFQLYDIMYSASGHLNATLHIDVLKTLQAKNEILEYGLTNMYGWSNMILGVAVLFCLLYAIVIWYRDFVGKSKTAYTLFMLPNNKFAIYIAKAITIVVMLYGVMVAQIITLLTSAKIISMLSGISMLKMKELLVQGVRLSVVNHLIQPYPVDFIMINILGVILAVVVIFTGVMMQLAEKKKGIILGVLYVLGIMMMYIGTLGYTYYSDIFLIKHIMFYIFIFVMSAGFSYYLLNKKIYM